MGDVLAIFDQNPFILNVDETETSVEISKSKLKSLILGLLKLPAKIICFKLFLFRILIIFFKERISMKICFSFLYISCSLLKIQGS